MGAHTGGTWESLVKRLAGVAERECANRGFAVMSVEILVDANGDPAFWTEPKLTKLEPRMGAGVFLDRLVSHVAKSISGKE